MPLWISSISVVPSLARGVADQWTDIVDGDVRHVGYQMLNRKLLERKGKMKRRPPVPVQVAWKNHKVWSRVGWRGEGSVSDEREKTLKTRLPPQKGRTSADTLGVLGATLANPGARNGKRLHFSGLGRRKRSSHQRRRTLAPWAWQARQAARLTTCGTPNSVDVSLPRPRALGAETKTELCSHLIGIPSRNDIRNGTTMSGNLGSKIHTNPHC